MRLVLFTFSIIVATTVLNTPTKAQNYPWCAIIATDLAVPQIAASQHLNNAWKPRAGSVACANRIRNTYLHPDHILTLS